MKTAKRRIPWVGLALVTALAAPGAAPAPPTSIGGPGSAYETLGQLVVMHEGRRKPWTRSPGKRSS
jgi:hypothetical protein